MRLIETIFALIGVCATVTVVFFYVGYTLDLTHRRSTTDYGLFTRRTN